MKWEIAGTIEALGATIWLTVYYYAPPRYKAYLLFTVLAILILLIPVNWGYEKRKKKELMRNPCEVHFLIPDIKRTELGYVKQDEKEHLVDEIVLPANPKVPVEVWIKPKINYYQTEYYFECEGELEGKPRPVKYYNPFVVEGRKEATPRENSNHYIDHHLYYHVRKKGYRVENEVYVSGFIIETRKEGRYKAQLLIHTHEGLGKAELWIRVEDKPKSKMKCVKHESCYLEPSSS